MGFLPSVSSSSWTFLLSLWSLAVVTNGQQELAATQFKSMLESGAFAAVLDVRSAAEFSQGHIGGATLMASLASGGSSPDSLAGCEFCDIAVYCNSGARAAAAIQVLKAAGFQGTLYNALGVQQWTAAGFPLVQTRSKTPVCSVQANTCSPGFVPNRTGAEGTFEAQQTSDGRFMRNPWNSALNHGGFGPPSNGGTSSGGSNSNPPPTGGSNPAPPSGPATQAPPANGGTGSPPQNPSRPNPWGPKWNTPVGDRPPFSGSGENPSVPPPQNPPTGPGGFPAQGSGAGGFPPLNSGTGGTSGSSNQGTGTGGATGGSSNQGTGAGGFPNQGTGAGGFPPLNSGTGGTGGSPGQGTGAGGFPSQSGTSGSAGGTGGFPGVTNTWTVRPGGTRPGGNVRTNSGNAGGTGTATTNANSVAAGTPTTNANSGATGTPTTNANSAAAGTPTTNANSVNATATGSTSAQTPPTTGTGTVGKFGNWTWKEGLESGASATSVTVGALLLAVLGVMV